MHLVKQILVLFLQCIALQVFSQQKLIVMDKQNNIPLPGAVVITNQDTALSDLSGSINLPGETTRISVRHLGYDALKLDIQGNFTNDTIWLTPSASEIEAVTVISPFLNKQQHTTPSSFARLKSENLLLENSFSYVEQLEQIPGITAQAGSFNTVRISIRGIGSRTPYGTNRIKAYLDNIPLTTGEGYSQIEDLDPVFIQSVNVTKGAKSALYGTGLGGILMLESKTLDKQSFSFETGFEGGSFATFKPFVLAGFNHRNTRVTAGYSFSGTDGWRENSNYKRHNGYANIKFSGPRSHTGILLYYIHNQAQIPSSINADMFVNSPERAAPNWLAVEGFENYTRFLSGINHVHELGERWEYSGSLTTSIQDGYESRPFNILDDNSQHITHRSSLLYRRANLIFRGGAEAQMEFYNWKLFETNEGVQGLPLSNFKEERYPLSVFLQMEVDLLKEIVLEGGVSYNVLKYQIQDNFEDTINLTGQYTFDPVISPFLGVNAPVFRNVRWYASIGHGLSYPNVEETLLPDYQINTSLKPETGLNLEAGIRGRLIENALFFDLAVYRMYVKNLLVTKRISEAVFYGENAGKSLHQGIELFATYYILKPVKALPEVNAQLGVNLTENKFREFIDEGNDYSNNSLPGLPSASVNANIRLQYNPGLYAMLSAKWVQEQYLDDANSLTYNGYALSSLKLGYKMNVGAGSAFDFYFGINNLFNRHYASMVLVNAPSFGGSAPRYYYPGSPRYFYAGFRFSFNEYP